MPENIYKNKKAFLIRNLGILQIKSKRININENEIKVTYEGDSYIHDKDRPYEGRPIISLFMNEGHYRKQENVENSKYPKTKTTSSILKIGQIILNYLVLVITQLYQTVLKTHY